MTKEEIIRLVKKTDLLGIIDSQYYDNELWIFDVMEFAKLVAKHTLMNVDPSKFMSFQEGIDVGRMAEREKCANICDESEYPDGIDLAYLIRARGQE